MQCCDVFMFVMFLFAAKKNSPRGQYSCIALYCIVLYCIVLYCKNVFHVKKKTRSFCKFGRSFSDPVFVLWAVPGYHDFNICVLFPSDRHGGLVAKASAS